VGVPPRAVQEELIVTLKLTLPHAALQVNPRVLRPPWAPAELAAAIAIITAHAITHAITHVITHVCGMFRCGGAILPSGPTAVAVTASITSVATPNLGTRPWT
jgi:hypothetical protein